MAEGNHNRICGLYYLESYCLQLESGRIDGHAEPVVNVDRPGAVRVDGRLGFAQSAFAAGFGAAVNAARSNGICGMSVEHTHTCTSLGYFTEGRDHGLVGPKAVARPHKKTFKQKRAEQEVAEQVALVNTLKLQLADGEPDSDDEPPADAYGAAPPAAEE